MSMLFGETLRNLRTEKGLSQRELAERMFVTRSTVNRWENGSRLPDGIISHTLLRAGVITGADCQTIRS